MQKYKVLIADDEKEIVDLLRDRLEACDFETCEVYEGVRAIEMAHKEKPNLILLDLKMPAGTGQSVLKSLKSHPETKRIPVIVISAMPAMHVKKEVLDAGADDFIQKPYDANILMDKILAILSR